MKPGSAKLLKFRTCPKDMRLTEGKEGPGGESPTKLNGELVGVLETQRTCECKLACPCTQNMFNTRVLLVSQTSYCKPAPEIGFFCRTSHALADDSCRSNSANLHSEKLCPMMLTTCCSLICC